MKKLLQALTVILAVVAFARPAIGQQPESESPPAAKPVATDCLACKAVQNEDCAVCPASCEECQTADQQCSACTECQACEKQCSTCEAVKPTQGVLACDKCHTIVAVTTDKQMHEIRTTCAESCPCCAQHNNCNGAECSTSAQCSIGDCTSHSCPECPASCTTCAFETAGPMPGSVSFVNENAGDLAQQRMQLAEDLADYLTGQKHSPDHIRQVLRMALESTADDAHRAAMSMRNSETYQVGAMPCKASACRNDQDMNQMRQMVMELRNEVDLMGESMRFLARYLHEQSQPVRQNEGMQNQNQQSLSQDSASPPVQYFRRGPEFKTSPPTSQQRGVDTASRNAEWTSQISPMPNTSYANQVLSFSTAQLLQRIHELEQQLQRTKQQPAITAQRNKNPEPSLPASWNSQGQLQPASWQSEPLRPTTTLNAQLNPAPLRVSTMMVRQYYIGDLVSPPFASSTLRLMQHIKTTIAPDSWEQASIQVVSPSVSLLVTQSPENHDKIARMLNDMRGGESFR